MKLTITLSEEQLSNVIRLLDRIDLDVINGRGDVYLCAWVPTAQAEAGVELMSELLRHVPQLLKEIPE